jgi:hypothetical protein
VAAQVQRADDSRASGRSPPADELDLRLGPRFGGRGCKRALRAAVRR